MVQVDCSLVGNCVDPEIVVQVLHTLTCEILNLEVFENISVDSTARPTIKLTNVRQGELKSAFCVERHCALAIMHLSPNELVQRVTLLLEFRIINQRIGTTNHICISITLSYFIEHLSYLTSAKLAPPHFETNFHGFLQRASYIHSSFILFRV